MPKKQIETKTTLVIVESPAKCKKIEEYLGPGYKCMASYGHLRELPSLEHINVKNNFEPTYTIIDQPLKKKQIELLKKEIKTAYEVVLACDADREGESICFHLCEIFGLNIERTKRIVFHEITESAIQYAIKNPTVVNMNLVRAQQARQILDLFVGFKISPILWKCISKKSEHSLSAGRCQTPALRLIYENQQEINKTIERKVFSTIGYFTNLNIPFVLNKEYETEEEMTDFLFGSQEFTHTYTCSKPEMLFKTQPEPFITSTLQQKASNELHYSPKETMKICQKLYEGGYITYMRTDSKLYSKDFVESSKKYIEINYDIKYINENIDSLILDKNNEDNKEKIEKPSKKGKKVKEEKQNFAQEAHEAIRVTNITLKELPDSVKESKERKLYQFIWENTIESCMAPASYYSIHAKINAFQNNHFSYTSEQIDFPGWKIVTNKNIEDSKEYHYLQTITQGFNIIYKKMISKVTIKNTKSHYTEARLVQLLEEKGIGRPSTFSTIIDKIQEREYVKKENIKGKTVRYKEFILEDGDIYEEETEREFGNEKNKLVIQPLGIIVMEFLFKHFNQLFEYDYTKQMEDKLDLISKGEKIWYDLCEECNNQIIELMDQLKIEKLDKKMEIKIDEQHSYIIGKHGPIIKCVEIIDSKEILSFKPVRKDIDIRRLEKGEYKLEDLIETNTNNQEKIKEVILGYHEKSKNNVVLKKGKFGLYITWGKNSKNLKEFGNRPIESIRFEEIEKYLDEGSNIIREISDNITIRKGPKGDYIFFKSSKMKKPQFYSLQAFKEDYCKCDLETIKIWIKEIHNIY